MSDFLVQIVHKQTGKVVRSWLPGEMVEKEFSTELLSRIKAKGIGLWKTEAHVLEDVRQAIDEMLYALKSMV